MGERKVINKYYPPEFDPTIIPKRKRNNASQCKVNMMIDFKLKCTTCGVYMNPGTKFNSRKETVQNDDYLGIKIFRFYIRCKNCHAEMTFRTDPKNSTYITEKNCAKILMPWDYKSAQVAQLDEQNLSKDAIQVLEEKTASSKKEMEDLDSLQELKEIRMGNRTVSNDELFSVLDTTHKQRQEEAAKKEADEIDDEVKNKFFVKKVESDDQQQPPQKTTSTVAEEATTSKKRKSSDSILNLVSLQRPAKKAKPNPAPANALAALSAYK